ncbi:MAG: cysteine desulfurase family protein [Parachlamydiaceae bacterium]|nr:cysteine desulfurase family protein [Parachlamydiaceae bacterium]
MNHIYLDYNASTPIDPRVLNALIHELKEEIGNPSSTHFHGKKCRQKLETSRKIIAKFLQVKPNEIYFTSGGTECAASLIEGIIKKNPNCHVISSSIEHSCIYETLKETEKKGTSVSFLPSSELGAIQPKDVESAIRDHTGLICLMAVNNETGVKTDIESIAKIAIKHQIPFIVDGVAWLGKEQIHIPEGVSAIFFSGHKIHAPKGIGFFYCRSNVKLIPLMQGGNQEGNYRPGTENLPGIVALSESISILEDHQKEHISHMTLMRDRLEKELLAKLPNVVINGSGPRICNTTNLAFLGVDGESLLMNLDMAGISVSHGSACSSGALEPSRILLGMSYPLSRVNSSIRFSVGRTTTVDEIDEAVRIIVKTVERMRS